MRFKERHSTRLYIDLTPTDAQPQISRNRVNPVPGSVAFRWVLTRPSTSPCHGIRQPAAIVASTRQNRPINDRKTRCSCTRLHLTAYEHRCPSRTGYRVTKGEFATFFLRVCVSIQRPLFSRFWYSGCLMRAKSIANRAASTREYDRTPCRAAKLISARKGIIFYSDTCFVSDRDAFNLDSIYFVASWRSCSMLNNLVRSEYRSSEIVCFNFS